MLHKRACWWKSQFSTGLNNRKTIGSLFQVLWFSMEEIQSYKVYVIYNGINLKFLLGLFFLNWLFSMLLFLFTKFYWVKTILYIWDSAIFFSEVWCQDLDCIVIQGSHNIIINYRTRATISCSWLEDALEYKPCIRAEFFEKPPLKQRNGLWKWGKHMQAVAYNGACRVFHKSWR